MATLEKVHGRVVSCAFGIDDRMNDVISFVVPGFKANCKFRADETYTAEIDLPDLLIEQCHFPGRVVSQWYFKALDTKSAREGVIRGRDIEIGNTDGTGIVCWGGNRTPRNSAEALTTFFNSPFDVSRVLYKGESDYSDRQQQAVEKNAERFKTLLAKRKWLKPIATNYRLVNGRIDAIATLTKGDLAKYKLEPSNPIGTRHFFPCIKNGTRYEIVSAERKVKF